MNLLFYLSGEKKHDFYIYFFPRVFDRNTKYIQNKGEQNWNESNPSEYGIIWAPVNCVDNIIAILSVLLNIDCHFQRAIAPVRLRLHVLVSHENRWSHTNTLFQHIKSMECISLLAFRLIIIILLFCFLFFFQIRSMGDNVRSWKLFILFFGLYFSIFITISVF